MIKIDDGNFYLTGGGACYCMRRDGDGLRRVCFGKRGEYEDDLTALIGADAPEISDDAFALMRDGKPVKYEFAIVEAETLAQKPTVALPTLRGGKTLKITLKDEAAALGLELYYTPVERGGIARRATLVNLGEPLTVTRAESGGASVASTALMLCGDAVKGANGRTRVRGAVVLADKNADETHGEAVGLYEVFGGARDAFVRETNGVTETAFYLDFSDEPYTLDAGESLLLPEVFAVYSDCGVGGLTRAAHDIIRERLIPARYAEQRRPIVLFDPELEDLDGVDGKKLSARAAAASRLGADTLLVSLGAADPDDKKTAAALDRAVRACDEYGVKTGVWAAFEFSDMSESGVPTELLRKRGRGKRAFDLGKPSAVEFLYGKIKSLVGAGVRHLKWESDGGAISGARASCYKYLRGLYELFARVNADFPELTTEGGFGGDIDCGILAYCPTVGAHANATVAAADGKLAAARQFPLCALGTYVDPTAGGAPLKTRFDIASLGALSYMAELSALGAEITAAVRAQIFSYQDDAALAACGDLYALGDGDGFGMLVASKDKSKAYAVCVNAGGRARVKLRGLDERNLYHVRELGKIYSGAALVGYGIPLPEGAGKNTSFAFHLGQVADYE